MMNNCESFVEIRRLSEEISRAAKQQQRYATKSELYNYTRQT